VAEVERGRQVRVVAGERQPPLGGEEVEELALLGEVGAHPLDRDPARRGDAAIDGEVDVGHATCGQSLEQRELIEIERQALEEGQRHDGARTGGCERVSAARDARRSR
jgi:hypothetical protein